MILYFYKCIKYKENPEDFSNVENLLKQLVNKLRQNFGTKGSIVTYNQSFEVSRLKYLMKYFSDDAKIFTKFS